jgi:DNA ligase (NAD+)
MPNAAFQKLNAEREQEGLARYANPRNSSAGSLRVLDPGTAASWQLDFYAYFLLADGQPRVNSHWEALEELAAMGFKVNPARAVCDDVEALLAFCRRYEAERETLPYEIDGVVAKVDAVEQQRRLGWTGEVSALGACVQVRGAAGRDGGGED